MSTCYQSGIPGQFMSTGNLEGLLTCFLTGIDENACTYSVKFLIHHDNYQLYIRKYALIYTGTDFSANPICYGGVLYRNFNDITSLPFPYTRIQGYNADVENFNIDLIPYDGGGTLIGLTGSGFGDVGWNRFYTPMNSPIQGYETYSGNSTHFIYYSYDYDMYVASPKTGIANTGTYVDETDYINDTTFISTGLYTQWTGAGTGGSVLPVYSGSTSTASGQIRFNRFTTSFISGTATLAKVEIINPLYELLPSRWSFLELIPNSAYPLDKLGKLNLNATGTDFPTEISANGQNYVRDNIEFGYAYFTGTTGVSTFLKNCSGLGSICCTVPTGNASELSELYYINGSDKNVTWSRTGENLSNSGCFPLRSTGTFSAGNVILWSQCVGGGGGGGGGQGPGAPGPGPGPGGPGPGGPGPGGYFDGSASWTPNFDPGTPPSFPPGGSGPGGPPGGGGGGQWGGGAGDG
jgi:hypothetical protein